MKICFKVMRSLSLFSVVLLLIFLYSCGGDNNEDTWSSNLQSNEVQKGVFIDSPVEGLTYKTATKFGVTDAAGSFFYNKGETIIFSIEDVVLGQGAASNKMSPIDLVPGATDAKHPTVTNICRFLQSLDVDGDPYNGIKINPDISDNVKGCSIVFTLSISDFENDYEVQDLFNAISADGNTRTLCSCKGAQNHLTGILNGYGPFDIDDDADGYTENQGDCDDYDDNIHPNAPEICGDGIDQDCNGKDCATWANIYESNKGRTVLISVNYSNGTKFSGSGFFIEKDVIVTCFHVVEPTYNFSSLENISITLFDTNVIEATGVDYSLENRDIAFLQVPKQEMEPVLLGDYNSLSVLDEIMHIGNPLGLDWTVTIGTVSALRKAEKINSLDWVDPDTDIIQHDISSDNGSSGGIILNDKGEAIGICFAHYKTTGEFRFGVSINYIKPKLNNLSFIPIGNGNNIDNDGDGYTENDGDCNDTDSSIYPGAPETGCDDIDQDCDGSDYCTIKWYKDADGDGYSDGTIINSIDRPNYQYYQVSELKGTYGDCDDGNYSIYPGAPEICGDGIDQDCDGRDCGSNYDKTALLKGTWYFYFTIISTFDFYYTLDEIEESSITLGEYDIFGKNEYGDLIVAGYSSSSGFWTLLDSGITHDYFYVFYTDGSKILENSCFYLIKNDTDDWSDCFTLHGNKISSLPRRLPSACGIGSSKNGQMDELVVEEKGLFEEELYTVDDFIIQKYRESKQLIDTHK